MSELKGEVWIRERRAGELEALLFASPRPVSVKQVAKRLGLGESAATALLVEYAEALRAPCRGLQLRESAGGWRLVTKPEHEDLVGAARAERDERPLSAPALEALAVVALRQPVSTAEVTAIRSLDSAATLETLLKRKMIVKTRAPALGKSMFWRTTQNFLDLFGLRSLDELYQGQQLQRVLGPAAAHGSDNSRPPGNL